MDKDKLPRNCNYYYSIEHKFGIDLSKIVTIGMTDTGDYRVRLSTHEKPVEYIADRGKLIFDAFLLWVDMQTEYPSYK